MTTGRISPRLLVVAAGLIAVCFALRMYLDYLDDPSALWRDLYHDRNTHLARGMALALDLRNFDPLTYLLDATSVLVWPPLHAVILSVVMAAFGVSSAPGIIPGLLGWILTILCLWQICRTTSSSEVDGILAGSVALIFALASPAFRLLSADVMLEGLGSGLSAAILLTFIYLTKRPGSRRLARWLALALTLLFFTKFNYWLILACSLLLACIPNIRFDAPRFLSGRSAVLSAGKTFLRNPVTLLAAGLAIATFAIAINGTTSLEAFGRTFPFRAGQWIVIPYGLCLVSACHAWRKHRDRLSDTLPQVALTLLGWHVVPMSIWFLVPEAMTSFLWFVGPTHWGAQTHYDAIAAARFQWWGFAHGFHVAPWSAVLALALAVPGGVALFPRGTGSRAVVIFAVVSALVIVLHPQQQWRFQTTSLFALWICSGVGAAALIHRLRGLTSAPAGISIAALGIAGFLVAHVIAIPNREDVDKVAIRTPQAPRDFDLAAVYLPHVQNTPAVGIATTFGYSDFFAWTIRQAGQCRTMIEQAPLIGAATTLEARQAMADWLSTTQATRIVFIDAPAPYPLPGAGDVRARLGGMDTVLAASGQFEQETPNTKVGLATIQIWRRASQSAAPPPRKRLFLVGGMAFLLGGIALGELIRGRRRRHGEL